MYCNNYGIQLNITEICSGATTDDAVIYEKSQMKEV